MAGADEAQGEIKGYSRRRVERAAQDGGGFARGDVGARIGDDAAERGSDAFRSDVGGFEGVLGVSWDVGERFGDASLAGENRRRAPERARGRIGGARRVDRVGRRRG